MEICPYISMLGLNFMGQVCCWYTFFSWCGCIDDREREQIQTQPPIQSNKEPNPFVVTGIPKDPHLLPAYS